MAYKWYLDTFSSINLICQYFKCNWIWYKFLMPTDPSTLWVYSPARIPGCEKKLDVRSSSLMMTTSLPLGLWSMPFVSEGWLFTFVLGSNSCTLLPPAPAVPEEREGIMAMRKRCSVVQSIYAHDVQAKSNKTESETESCCFDLSRFVLWCVVGIQLNWFECQYWFKWAYTIV